MAETIDINIDEIRQKLYEKLKPSGWGDKLKGFILGHEFEQLIMALHADVQEGNRFTPPLKVVFRAFEECPYKDLKVVMTLQDPYPQKGIADGIAMSCSNDGVIQKSLKYVYQQVQHTVYHDQPYNREPDLKHWSNQGILMLNTALTTTIGKTGRHYLVWQPFIAYLLDILGAYNPGLIYIFMGKKAQEYAESIPDNNYKLMISHPASAAYVGAETWDCEDVFNKTNSILKKSNNLEIKW